MFTVDAALCSSPERSGSDLLHIVLKRDLFMPCAAMALTCKSFKLKVVIIRNDSTMNNTKVVVPRSNGCSAGIVLRHELHMYMGGPVSGHHVV